jgi:hypothetical protein
MDKKAEPRKRKVMRIDSVALRIIRLLMINIPLVGLEKYQKGFYLSDASPL